MFNTGPSNQMLMRRGVKPQGNVGQPQMPQMSGQMGQEMSRSMAPPPPASPMLNVGPSRGMPGMPMPNPISNPPMNGDMPIRMPINLGNPSASDGMAPLGLRLGGGPQSMVPPADMTPGPDNQPLWQRYAMMNRGRM